MLVLVLTRRVSSALQAWIQDSKVLDVVLQGNLHQPQYVEKLEKILRFMIKVREGWLLARTGMGISQWAHPPTSLFVCLFD